MTKGKGRPTIIDVARKAGVSKSTVSLVVRNSPTIKEETRKLVRRAMAELGYVYNRSAANMRSSNAGLIGLVINDLRNPFFTEFATSLQMTLAAKGYATVVANSDESAELQSQLVGSMIEHGVSGFIICPAYGDTRATFDTIARAGVPVLQMLRCADERLDQFPFIAPNYAEGSAEAARHLVATGAGNIAFVGGLAGRSVTEERMAGYLEILGKNGMTPLVLNGQATRDFGRSMARTLCDSHPQIDAAICFNDLVALGLLSGLHEMNREIGRDFRVVGFDDIEETAQSYPPLSSVSCGIELIGAQAAQTIVGWLETGEAPGPETRTPIRLVIRRSSDPGAPA